MSFKVPEGHYLVSYDYGMGALWWIIKAASAEDICRASNKLTVHDDIPRWIMDNPESRIETDDLNDPQSEALRLVLAGID